MATALEIEVKFSAGICEGFEGIDKRATLRSYAETVRDALVSRFPDADVDVRQADMGWIRAWRGDEPCDDKTLDAIRETVGRVYESETWAVCK